MTSPPPSVQAIAEEFRRECAEDYVGLWQIARSFTSEKMSNDALAERIVQVATHLLADGTTCLGQFHDSVFEPWDGDTATQLAKLREELYRLGRAPDIGEIGWFAAR